MSSDSRNSSYRSEHVPHSSANHSKDFSALNDDAPGIDAGQMISDALRMFISNWWLFILSAIVACSLLCFKTYKSFRPIYQSKATFTVNVVGVSGTSGAYYSQSTAEQLSKTFPAILTSGIIETYVCEDLGIKSLNASINAYVEGSTALFTIETTATDPDTAFGVLKSVIKVYPDVALFVVGNTELNLISEPQLATSPINSINYVASVEKGLAIALLLSILVAFVLSVTDKTVRSSDDIKRIISLRCIGNIPFARSIKHGKRREFTSIEKETTSRNFVDAVNLIGTRIEKSMQSNNEKVLLIASSVPGEGKTTVTVNLALALAMRGNKVIIVDCDIRKPTTIGDFKFTTNKGLVDFLLGQARIDEIISKANDNLDVINGVRNSEDAAELFQTPAMANLIDKLKNYYDFVILDSPPTVIMADTSVIAPLADSIVYVACQNYTRKSSIIDGMTIISNSDTRCIGYVMNNSSNVYNNRYEYGNSYYSNYKHTY